MSNEDSGLPVQQEGSERRRFFRIEDEVTLFYREVDDQQVIASLGETSVDNSFFDMATEYNHVSQEFTQQVKRLNRDSVDVVECLKLVDQKLDMIARLLFEAESNRHTESPSQAVNLSAAGISFRTEKPLAAGAALELKMILPFSLLAINAYGRVVHCKPSEGTEDSDSPYQVGIDFIGLSNEEREQLIRYVVKKQMSQIRELRDEAE